MRPRPLQSAQSDRQKRRPPRRQPRRPAPSSSSSQFRSTPITATTAAAAAVAEPTRTIIKSLRDQQLRLRFRRQTPHITLPLRSSSRSLLRLSRSTSMPHTTLLHISSCCPASLTTSPATSSTYCPCFAQRRIQTVLSSSPTAHAASLP